MIKEGALVTYDGQVDVEELLRVFPSVRWEDDGEYSRVEEIKRKAFGKRIFERALPDKEVLAERLYELGKEFASAKSLLRHYDQVFSWLGNRLDDLAERGVEAAEVSADLKRWLHQQIKAAPEEAERGKALLAEESVMRIMSANVRIEPSGHEFMVEGNDTLLEAALRAGIPLNYGCSNGNCGECRARLVSGQVTKVHPHDFVLKETDKGNGAILLCSYTAVTDVVIEASVAGAEDIPPQHIATKVRAIEPLGPDVLALHLTTPRSQRLRFLAGQAVTLHIGDIEADYHLASCPCEDRHIEVHVRRDNRPFARKAFADLRKEEIVTLDGPRGDFVMTLDSRRPVIFVAWEEGFAPIKSLIQHAMSLEIAESIHLYWFAGPLGQYQENLCRAWADALDHFHYMPIEVTGPIEQTVGTILAHHPDLAHFDIYATGPALLLDSLREAAFARGLAPQGWHAELTV